MIAKAFLLFHNTTDEKYLITEFYILFNRLKYDLKSILLIKDDSLKIQIRNVIEFFVNSYNCTIETRNEVNNFLKLISVT